MGKKYRKKPVVIDAWQITKEWFTKDHPNELHIHTPDREVVYDPVGQHVQIHTLEGVMIGNVGDWIIRGVSGEYYPCKNDIFKMTYEEVEDGTA